MKKLAILMLVMLALLSQGCGLLSDESDLRPNPKPEEIEQIFLSTKPDEIPPSK